MKRGSSLRRSEPYPTRCSSDVVGSAAVATGSSASGSAATRAPKRLAVIDSGQFDRNVDRLAAPALDAQLAVHPLGRHRRGEDVAAAHADVVVGPVAAEYRALK